MKLYSNQLLKSKAQGLSVFFRPKELSGPAPILVWIHGGGLQFGSGMAVYYNATYLAKDGAQIVINISYRLGILGGFLKRFL